MYEIWADDDLLIYSDVSPLESVKVIEPRLTLADSAAGSLEMTLPPTNVGYSVIQRMTTDIIVKCEGEEIWRGRLLTDDYDFWNRRKMMCEGELAILNDTIQPQHQYLSDTTTIETFLGSLLDIHNSKVSEDKRFILGMVTVTDGDQQDDSDAIYRYTNYETTLECINDKLVSRLGGHIVVRHQNGQRYLDYLSDDNIGQNSQIIRFGVNLMDFVKSFDMTELATVLVPRGARLDEEVIEGLEAYLTVEGLGVKTELNEETQEQEVWHEDGSLYVVNPTAKDTYGWIEAVVDWDQVTDANNLYTKAVKYLKDEQYNKMVLEIKAVDLHYASGSNDRIKMLDKLRCISEPHGMDHTFPITQMDIRLDRPDDSMYTLGTEVNMTLTQSTSKVQQETMYKIEQLPTKHEILKAAEQNAFNILTGVDGGYVRFEQYPETDPHYNPNYPDAIHSIIISDGPTDDESLHKWQWTEGGLGHYHRDTYQDDWTRSEYESGVQGGARLDVAITMDGKIVANAITTGILKAVNDKYELNTQTGYVKMETGKFGPWYLNPDGNGRGFTNGINAWIDPDMITCGNYGATFIGMRGSSSSHSGYFEVGVNEQVDCIHIFYNSIAKTHYDGSQEFAKWDSGSDERIKKDIEELTLEEAKKIVLNTDPLTFRYKDNDKIKHYGVTAQRMQKECKDLGLENPFVKEMHDDILTVDYDQFIAPIMKVIQDQQKQIEELKKSSK